MAFYDVFNGDADGICALLQWRLSKPRDGVLVTGIKRDISLLHQVTPKQGDQITVLDISLDKNRSALEIALEAGAHVFYVDHHYAGEIPHHENFESIINTRSEVCTSVLMNGYLRGQYQAWAIVGAFGDNLDRVANELADQLSLNTKQRSALSLLGNCINYNAYGESREDLHFQPEDVFSLALPYSDPFEFIDSEKEFVERLIAGYREDFAKAISLQPIRTTATTAIFNLPGEAWARRVSGVWANELSNEHPDRAHALLTPKTNGNYLVSVRAPKNNKVGADEVCRQFATGGGRVGAAGINELSPNDVEKFIQVFESRYSIF